MTRSITFTIAASGDAPLRISSTARNAPHTLMFASPRPVEPAAPTVLSQYCPAPMIGLSPTRPAIFHEMPLVVVTELMSPAALTQFMLIVPVVNGTDASVMSSQLPAPPDRPLPVPAAGGSSQLDGPLRLAFQRSHAWRERSVSNSCSTNPSLRANRLASGPTRRMWSV